MEVPIEHSSVAVSVWEGVSSQSSRKGAGHLGKVDSFLA